MNREIEKTADGSPTLYGADIDEHYHSAKGALDESMHVYVKPGWEKAAKGNVRRSLQEVEVIPERIDGPEEGKREVLRAVPLRHNVLFLYKGEDLYRDEYSIFRAEKGSLSMDIFLRNDQISHLDICGLAGDVCVSTTLDDALWRYPRIRYRLLDRFTASLDGGDTVRQWCKDLARRNRRMDEEGQNKLE